MIKKIAFVAALFGGASTQAQITIDRNDFGAIGDVLYYATDTTLPTNFSVGASGANITWNFATVGSNYSDSTLFVEPSILVGGPEQANLAVVEGDVPEFYFIDATGVNVLQPTDGFIEGDPVSLRIMNFPFSFGNTVRDSNELKFTTTPGALGFDLPFDSIRITVNVSSVSVADGWGNLITPTGSYNALRIKNTSDAVITVEGKVPFIGTWTPIPFDFGNQRTVQYQWFGKNEKYNLASAELDDSGRVVTFKYQTAGLLASTTELLHKLNVNLSPNPVKDLATISQTKSFGKDATVVVFDAAGKKVTVPFTVNQSQMELNTATLANGIYTVMVKDGNQIGQVKILVQH